MTGRLLLSRIIQPMTAQLDTIALKGQRWSMNMVVPTAPMALEKTFKMHPLVHNVTLENIAVLKDKMKVSRHSDNSTVAIA